MNWRYLSLLDALMMMMMMMREFLSMSYASSVRCFTSKKGCRGGEEEMDSRKVFDFEWRQWDDKEGAGIQGHLISAASSGSQYESCWLGFPGLKQNGSRLATTHTRKKKARHLIREDLTSDMPLKKCMCVNTDKSDWLRAYRGPCSENVLSCSHTHTHKIHCCTSL